MVQLFLGWFFWLCFYQLLFQKMYEMKGNKRKRKKKATAASSQQPASQQYIYQYKIQSIVPNTFSKESIAQQESLHNQLKKYYLPSTVEGGVINHYPTLHAAGRLGISKTYLFWNPRTCAWKRSHNIWRKTSLVSLLLGLQTVTHPRKQTWKRLNGSLQKIGKGDFYWKYLEITIFSGSNC